MALCNVKRIDFIIRCLLILAILGVYRNSAGDDEPISNIRKLRKDLMRNYDKFSRPVKNASVSVGVWIQMVSFAVSELNESQERMVADTIAIMSWRDEHLEWDPSQYNGVEEFIFNERDIWHPDVAIRNSAPVTENSPWNKTNMFVTSRGVVYWHPPASISLRCPMPPLKPLDERLCNLSIGSYSHFSHELDLRLFWKKMDLGIVNNDNPTWVVTNMTVSLEKLTYGTLEYFFARFSVSLKRRYDFTSDVVRGPRTIAILLTLSMFWLPPTSYKKLNLGCLVLLVLSGITMYFSSTVVSPSLLAANVAPLRITLFTVASAMLIEVFIMNLSRLSDILKPSPTVIRVLSGTLGSIVGICPRAEYKEERGIGLPEEGEEENFETLLTIEDEWSVVAMALDRLFFTIYSFIFIAVS